MGLLDALPWRRPASAASAPADDPFDDDFQRKLEYLAIVSRRVFAGRLRAERRTKKSGSGVEFADHREYQPGDDFRYLDWNVYQRLERLLVRLYEEEEDLAIYLVLDTSASMGFGGLVTTSDRVMDRMPETRGKARIFKVFRFLREARAEGTTDLADALKTFVAQNKRRGLVVLVSDLYDPHGFEQGINILRYNKFDPFVVHVVDPADAKPRVRGDVLLYDCETGDEREVTVTPGVLKSFGEAYERYVAEVGAFCVRRQVSYVTASLTMPFDELILRVFRRGGFLR